MARGLRSARLWRMAWVLLILLADWVMVADHGLAQAAKDEKKPAVSDDPMTADQLAIYRVVLRRWMDNGKASLHLSITTTSAAWASTEGEGCAKGLEMEPDGTVQWIHRFRKEDLPKLGSSKIELVDPEAQEKEVAENDPGKHIGGGESIGEAVGNGFAHGLITLGEIHFDTSHTHAVVWYGFHCGRLCGNGGTVLLEKRDAKWVVKSQCGNWIS